MNVILPLIRLSKQLLVNDIAKTKCLNPTTSRNFHITSSCTKEVRVGKEIISVGESNKYAIMEGEQVGSVYDITQHKKLFPDAETPTMLFSGVQYQELPIVNVKSTPNNTIMSLTDYKGKILATHSAGAEGFKNAKKGTNIAAQQAAISFSYKVRQHSFVNIRVRIKGLGAGRMASLKGLEMGGLNIISITDTTGVSWNPPRPKKPRKL